MKYTWRKSSRSNSAGGACVEVGQVGSSTLIRDSKLGDDSPIFRIDHDDIRAITSVAR